jgi:hypothetical protein
LEGNLVPDSISLSDTQLIRGSLGTHKLPKTILAIAAVLTLVVGKAQPATGEGEGGQTGYVAVGDVVAITLMNQTDRYSAETITLSGGEVVLASPRSLVHSHG